jgi:hypothetical protein
VNIKDTISADSQEPGSDLNDIPRRQGITFDLTKIIQNKRDFRQRLAARPIEEKLAMLDALRARTIALRGSRAESQPGTLREEPPAYRTRPKNVE